MNGDHWLLYLTSPSTRLTLKPSDHKLPNGIIAADAATTRQSSHLRPATRRHQDQTLEILMTHLAPAARAPFFHPAELDPTHAASSDPTKARSGHHLGAILTTHLGIDDLFSRDETTIDAFGFEPCGYSANGIVGSGSVSAEHDGEGGGYFTIHVTPEEGWSFASFESNVPLTLTQDGAPAAAGARPDLQTLIRKVIDIFQPGRLSITLFLSTPSEEETEAGDSDTAADDATRQAWSTFSKSLLGNGYVRQDRIGYEFEGYDLVFGCFERRGFEGGKVAVAPDV